jgi:hypothetical protein
MQQRRFIPPEWRTTDGRNRIARTIRGKAIFETIATEGLSAFFALNGYEPTTRHSFRMG